MSEAIRQAAVGGIRHPETGTVQRTFRFTNDFPGFAGHFPGYPILPAVVQLHAGLCLAEDACGAPLRLAGVENAKFLQQLRPEEEIVVECRERLRGEEWSCAVRLWRGEELAASFQLLLEAGEGEGC